MELERQTFGVQFLTNTRTFADLQISWQCIDDSTFVGDRFWGYDYRQMCVFVIVPISQRERAYTYFVKEWELLDHPWSIHTVFTSLSWSSEAIYCPLLDYICGFCPSIYYSQLKDSRLHFPRATQFNGASSRIPRGSLSKWLYHLVSKTRKIVAFDHEDRFLTMLQLHHIVKEELPLVIKKHTFCIFVIKKLRFIQLQK